MTYDTRWCLHWLFNVSSMCLQRVFGTRPFTILLCHHLKGTLSIYRLDSWIDSDFSYHLTWPCRNQFLNPTYKSNLNRKSIQSNCSFVSDFMTSHYFRFGSHCIEIWMEPISFELISYGIIDQWEESKLSP